MGILSITLYDLRFRIRQFVITVVGAALVFAMGLLLSGMAAGFSAEIDQTVKATSANWWVIAGGSGRLGALPVMPESTVAKIAAEPGARGAAPIVVGGQSAKVGSGDPALVLIGALPGRLGSTGVSSGHPVHADGETVVDSRLGIGIGGRLEIAGVSLTVVGKVSNRTMFAGQPDVYVTLRDSQRILFGGQHLVSAVVTTGRPARTPAKLGVYSDAEVDHETIGQMSSAVSSISNTRIFMWAIAAFIVAALVYVSTLERRRDFAVLKALGSSSGLLFVGLVVQAVMVALTAAAIAAVISTFMTGLFAQRVEIPGSAFVVLPLSALVVGILASLVALRHAVSADPATAFAGG